jgi:protocatechuate 3,4-dioxygenase beta subunit
VLDKTVAIPLDSLAYRFDIVLRGARATWFEDRVQTTGARQRE